MREEELKNVIENETGEHFDRHNKICCPFHHEKTPSFSVKYDPNTDKTYWKCFGCGEGGDAINFIEKIRGVGYKGAREILGMPVEKTDREKIIEKINNFAIKDKFYKDKKLIGIFPFYIKNEFKYAKVKLLREDGKKETPYISLDRNGDIVKKREGEEIPYTSKDLNKAMEENNTIVIVEGEKDVNTLSNIFYRNYCIISIKNVKEETLTGIFKGKQCNFIIIPDTGRAGEEYRSKAEKLLKKYAISWKNVKLTGVEELGDNKDVTDWLESGHTREELKKIFDNTLDILDMDNLQQDYNGIYFFTPLKINKKGEIEEDRKKVYITDFIIISAHKLNNIPQCIDQLELTLKNNITGKEICKVINPKDTTDCKSFRVWAGFDFNLMTCKSADLVRIFQWINRYFVTSIKNDYVFDTLEYNKDTEEFTFNTAEGTIKADKSIDTNNIASESHNTLKDITTDSISLSDAGDLIYSLFNFNKYDYKVFRLLGSTANVFYKCHAKESGIKNHMTLLFGEAGSGKSTILENVIAPLLNISSDDIRKFNTTHFAFIKELSNGNYATLMDEYKPSKMPKPYNDKVSDILRNLYDNRAEIRGNKDQTVNKYVLNNNLFVCGEETWYNDETALIERSSIIEITKEDQTDESTHSINYLMEHKELLNLLGKELLIQALNTSLEEYKQIRKKIDNMQCITLKNRYKNTLVNTLMGIDLIKKVVEKITDTDIANTFIPGLEDIAKMMNDKFIEEKDNDSSSLSAVDKIIVYAAEASESGVQDMPEDVIFEYDDEIYMKPMNLFNALKKLEKYDALDFDLISKSTFMKQVASKGYSTGKTVLKKLPTNDGHMEPSRVLLLYKEKLMHLDISIKHYGERNFKTVKQMCIKEVEEC